MKILISILLASLMVGCGSSGDTFNTDGNTDKIGEQNADDFYFDLAEAQDPTGSFMIGESRFVTPRRRVRHRLTLKSDGVYIYRQVVEIFRSGTKTIIRDEFERVNGTWRVDGNELILRGLGVAIGRFDESNNRTLEVEFTRDFRYVDIFGEEFTFTLFEAF